MKTAYLPASNNKAAGVSAKILAFFALTKPRVVELLLVVTAPTMVLAHHGIPDVWLMISVLIGGATSAGSAGAFNSYIDRDIDRLMKRTENRPLVTGAVTEKAALIFALSLGVFSTLWLLLTTNLLTTMLSVIAIALYVVFYTLILKRRTEQNIIWGGIAGCMPVLIAWAAVRNELSVEPFVLFLIIFLWTPPHYWPLALKYQKDYTSAEIPMLSVTQNRLVVGTHVVLYAWASVAATFLLVPVANMGLLYVATASLCGIFFLWESHRIYSHAKNGINVSPMRLFHGSIAYLTLIFIAVGIDPLFNFPLFF